MGTKERKSLLAECGRSVEEVHPASNRRPRSSASLLCVKAARDADNTARPAPGSQHLARRHLPEDKPICRRLVGARNTYPFSVAVVWQMLVPVPIAKRITGLYVHDVVLSARDTKIARAVPAVLPEDAKATSG